jgi:cytochrome c
MAYQLKAQSEKDGDHYLAGAVLDNWNATSLAGDSVSGLGAWSKEEIAQFLKSGRTDRVAAAGPMAEVVEKSTQFLNDQDLLALGEYLKSLPPLRVKLKQKSFLQTSEVSHAKFEDTAWRRRLTVYLNNCKICHGQNGEGEKRIYPNLTKNEAVNAPNPISLIHLVLTGSIMHATQTAPTELEMPGLGWRLGDAEVADVLCFVRSHWDNHASQVSPRYVGRIRKKLEKALR